MVHVVGGPRASRGMNWRVASIRCKRRYSAENHNIELADACAHAPQGEADEEDNVYVCSWMYTISKNGLKTAQETPETPPQLPQDT